tara:strand:+ start:777 stop:998 length:222 start_codon:yes stop_codon:yes gene_type:complete
VKTDPFDFDYWANFKAAVKQGIAPSEVWQLDYPELFHILELSAATGGFDIAMMINAERRSNGARDPRYLIDEH